jgi:hypothetical protein
MNRRYTMDYLSKRAFAIVAFLTIISLNACGGGGDSGGSPGNGPDGVKSASDTTPGQIVGFGIVIVNDIGLTRKTGLADNRIKPGFDNISVANEERL